MNIKMYLWTNGLYYNNKNGYNSDDHERYYICERFVNQCCSGWIYSSTPLMILVSLSKTLKKGAGWKKVSIKQNDELPSHSHYVFLSGKPCYIRVDTHQREILSKLGFDSSFWIKIIPYYGRKTQAKV